MWHYTCGTPVNGGEERQTSARAGGRSVGRTDQAIFSWRVAGPFFKPAYSLLKHPESLTCTAGRRWNIWMMSTYDIVVEIVVLHQSLPTFYWYSYLVPKPTHHVVINDRHGSRRRLTALHPQGCETSVRMTPRSSWSISFVAIRYSVKSNTTFVSEVAGLSFFSAERDAATINTLFRLTRVTSEA